MKKSLAVILIMVCASVFWAKYGYPAVDAYNDPESLIRSLEKSIAEQENLINRLRARYAKIIAQKKQLTEWIEQEKQKLAEKQAMAAQPKVEKPIARPKILVEQKKPVPDSDREFEISQALEKKKKPRDTQDINYLSLLIEKQKDLCAAIIRLEGNIAAEEKNLKQLKESRKFPANSS